MIKKQADVTIVGGGIIGLSTAYHLIQKGLSVQIIDSDKVGKGAAEKNAALVSPSHFIPLAQPGVLTSGLKWLLNSKSPLYIKPSLDSSLLKWLYQFMISSNKSSVKKAIPILNQLLEESRKLFKNLKEGHLSSLEFYESGLLNVYKSRKSREQELENLKIAEEIGVEAKEVPLESFMPGVKINALAGIYYPNDATADPISYMNSLLKYFKKQSVAIYENIDISKIERKNKTISSIYTDQFNFTSKYYIFSAGAYTSQILNQLKIPCLMQPAKGYSLTCNYSELNLKCPIIFTEGKVVITPLKGKTRFAGTLEINGFKKGISKNRILGIKNTVKNYLPNFDQKIFNDAEEWYGFRSVTPDGLPYLGKHSDFSNLFINTGHAMLGLTLAPISGKIISDLIANEPTNYDLKPLDPCRFNPA